MRRTPADGQLEALLGDPARPAMREAAQGLSHPDAAARVAAGRCQCPLATTRLGRGRKRPVRWTCRFPDEFTSSGSAGPGDERHCHRAAGHGPRPSRGLTPRLVGGGAPPFPGHHGNGSVIGPRNLGEADAVTSSPAVGGTGPENVELAEAQAAGLLVVPRSGHAPPPSAPHDDALAVAGTHGQDHDGLDALAHPGRGAGLRPSFVIGCDVNEIGNQRRVGHRRLVDGGGRRELRDLPGAIRPDVAVLTNVEPDHLDYYGTVRTNCETAFSEFVGGGRRRGPWCGRTTPEAAAIGPGAQRPSRSARGGRNHVHRMTDLQVGPGARCPSRMEGPEGTLGTLDMGVPGLHNARNEAVAAVAALKVAGARFAAAPGRVGPFRRGPAGASNSVARPPASPSSTIMPTCRPRSRPPGAARTGGWAPRRSGLPAAPASLGPPPWRLVSTAFSEADVLIVTDVYNGGEPPPVPGVSGRPVADAVRSSDPRPRSSTPRPGERLRRRRGPGLCRRAISTSDPEARRPHVAAGASCSIRRRGDSRHGSRGPWAT